MKFRNYVLDKFQEDAVKAIDNNHSVVVSAPTGTGKTLIADYLIDKYIDTGKVIIYTSPIKALSNQKYKQFCEAYGEEKIGLLTGDFVFNPEAPVLIMTTEVYRNMLVTKDEFVKSISYVIFDEIHYINDLERGTVWEESIIFSPETVRFLCLSATIPNAKEFAKWIEETKNHKVEVVINTKRAVPLKHFVYEKTLGIVTLDELEQFVKSNPLLSRRARNKKEKRKLMNIKAADHIDLITDVKEEGFLPIIYFNFSRKDCEKKSEQLYQRFDFTNNKEKEQIIYTFNKHINEFPSVKDLFSVNKLRRIIKKGIAYHHAGLLPVLKEIVEDLFSQGLIKVLYATETFAVGINMPAKSVAFDSLEKYDGRNFRYLTSKEYWQMAGRAGRRGIDKEGWAIALVDIRFADFDRIRYITSGDKEPLVSRFYITDNLVLNMIMHYNEEQIKEILKKSFYYFLKKQEDTAIRIWSRFKNRVKKLMALGYIEKDGKSLTEKGRFASKIYDHEIEITEMFKTNIFKSLEESEINALIAAIIYDRKIDREHFKIYKDKKRYNKILKVVRKESPVLFRKLNRQNLLRLMRIVIEWSEGKEFSEIVKLTSMKEGDLIRLFRQIADFLNQVRKASDNWEIDKISENCIARIKRDIVDIL
ncbi:MAG: hypothetical protein PWP03_448 [Candidatus Woesearchaeota archaeon]|nr:hypothetical protein [Candidatus Woesearchaeota archaeon]